MNTTTAHTPRAGTVGRSHQPVFDAIPMIDSVGRQRSATRLAAAGLLVVLSSLAGAVAYTKATERPGYVALARTISYGHKVTLEPLAQAAMVDGRSPRASVGDGFGLGERPRAADGEAEWFEDGSA